MSPAHPIDLSSLHRPRPGAALAAPAGAGGAASAATGPATTAPTPVTIPGDREWRAPLERLLGAVLVLAGARAGMLRLLDPSNGALLLVGAAGEVDVQRLDTLQRPGGDCGVCAEVLRLDQPRCETAVCACAREVARGLDRLGAGQGRGAEAGEGGDAPRDERVFVLPLHHGAAPCGVLNLFFDGVCEVPASLQALLPAIGDMLGLALENQRLARRALQDSVGFERLMLAGEVHDSLAQSLTWMRMRLTMLRGAVDQGDRVSAERYLRDLDASLAGAHGRMRELIADFRTRMDPQGLLQALRQVAEQLGSLGGFEVAIVDQAGVLELGAEQELQVFHILREALANVAKHAQARRVQVTLAREAGQIRILVEDDGVGLPELDHAGGSTAAPLRRGHFGLDLMRERARLIGGQLELLSSGAVGTTLRLCFPDPAAAPAGDPGLAAQPVHPLRAAHG
ncbi:MAG TPA: ATP-binding protein [Burkholderiaceae bacterium]|nr:ATP-binding protein [Burkholderiaceae bacterium]HNB46307.1 ATP-binding protein [Burkholderiaceae bacterium]HNG78900.1 ATP-binding protein [Burkholderiaceae bacterium]